MNNTTTYYLSYFDRAEKAKKKKKKKNEKYQMLRSHLSIRKEISIKRLRGAFIDNFFFSTSVSRRRRLSDFFRQKVSFCGKKLEIFFARDR